MSKSNNSTQDAETILMALDQISQTIDVMTSVVGRLRNYVQQQETKAGGNSHQDLQAEIQSDRVIH